MSQKPKEPNVYSSADLTYGTYLKIDELLSLQQPISEPAHNDELLFIIIHQSYELWFKLIINELENAKSLMEQKQVLRAHHFLSRVNVILKNLVGQIHILETMAPAEFLKFRYALNPASGFQSLQFRELEFLLGLKDSSYFEFFKNRPEMTATLQKRFEGKDFRQTYYELLRDLGFEMPADFSKVDQEPQGSPAREQVLRCLKNVYENHERMLPLYLLTEALVECDESLALWRDHHVRVVERVIGFKKGTGGSSGAAYLRSTTSKKCFPLLWEVRSHLA